MIERFSGKIYVVPDSGRGGDLPGKLIFRNHVKPLRAKIFRFSRNTNQTYDPLVPLSQEGRFAIRQERWERDAMDLLALLTNAAKADGEIAWS